MVKCVKFLFLVLAMLSSGPSFAMEDKLLNESTPLVRGGVPVQVTMTTMSVTVVGGASKEDLGEAEANYQAALQFLQEKGIPENFTEQQIWENALRLNKYLKPASDLGHVLATMMLVKSLPLDATTRYQGRIVKPEDCRSDDIRLERGTAKERVGVLRLLGEKLQFLIDSPSVSQPSKIVYRRQLEELSIDRNIEKINFLLKATSCGVQCPLIFFAIICIPVGMPICMCCSESAARCLIGCGCGSVD